MPVNEMELATYMGRASNALKQAGLESLSAEVELFMPAASGMTLPLPLDDEQAAPLRALGFLELVASKVDALIVESANDGTKGLVDQLQSAKNALAAAEVAIREAWGI